MPTTQDIKLEKRPEAPAFKRPRAPRVRPTVIIGIAVLVVIAIVALSLKGVLFFKKAGQTSGPSQTGGSGLKTAGLEQGLQPSAYSAVFLTNGQVYFGQLKDSESTYPVLRDIYYLRLKEPLQQQRAENTDTGQPELTLIKLGNELHGPIDEMKLNKDHILFIEILREDSKVVGAIKQYQEQVKPWDSEIK